MCPFVDNTAFSLFMAVDNYNQPQLSTSIQTISTSTFSLYQQAVEIGEKSLKADIYGVFGGVFTHKSCELVDFSHRIHSIYTCG